MPDARGEVVKVLPSKNPNRRVVIVRRPDGYYATRQERLDPRERAMTTTPLWYSIYLHSGIFATVEIAEREAYAEYPDVRPAAAD